MFWSGNYTAVRELNFLLKEKNVTLSQVLEADDILQECKADNKTLIQFLMRPDILAELITLITEEPPKDVELTAQYRHASVACEVLTSQLSTLSDRLSSDTEQMHRLCDFLHKPPPLNPLLASYFSKTVEMLLDRNPKQDWYLYQIVCLRVMDFFKSRPDFLPNLLRHMSTSSIADVFKCFIRLDDLFSKNIIEWLDQHQVVDSLIEIVCCTYNPEETQPVIKFKSTGERPPEHLDKAEQETSEKSEIVINTEPHSSIITDAKKEEDKDLCENNNSSESSSELNCSPSEDCSPDNSNIKSNNMNNDVEAHKICPQKEKETKECGDTNKEELEQRMKVKKERMKAIASANAAALLIDLVNNGCSGEFSNTRSQTSLWLLDALFARVPALLQGMCSDTRAAIVSGAKILCAIQIYINTPGSGGGGGPGSLLARLEAAIALHVPILHQALLKPASQDVPFGRLGVGEARVAVMALLALLARCRLPDVPKAMLALGTPGACFELMLRYPDCTLLHAEVYQLLRNALSNESYAEKYAAHLFVECDLLNRLMDVFEESEAKRKAGGIVPAVRGHALLCLRRALAAADAVSAGARGPGEAGAALAEAGPRWAAFVEDTLRPLAFLHDTPLGGQDPHDHSVYDYMRRPTYEPEPEEVEDVNTDEVSDYFADANEARNEARNEAQEEEYATRFRQLANIMVQVVKGDGNMWDDTPEEDGEGCEGDDMGVGGGAAGGAGAAGPRGEDDALAQARDVLAAPSPWECAPAADSHSEGWAQFSSDAFPSDPFPPSAPFASPSDPFPAAVSFASPSAPFASPSASSSAPADGFDADQDWGFGTKETADGIASAGSTDVSSVTSGMEALRVVADDSSLAGHVLTAMSSLSAATLATLGPADMTDILPATAEHAANGAISNEANTSVSVISDSAVSESVSSVSESPVDDPSPASQDCGSDS